MTGGCLRISPSYCIILILLIAIQESAAGISWIPWVLQTGHYIGISDDYKNWRDAKTACEEQGTGLLPDTVDISTEAFLHFMEEHCPTNSCYTGEHRFTSLSVCQGGTVSLTENPHTVTTEFIDCPFVINYICYGVPSTETSILWFPWTPQSELHIGISRRTATWQAAMTTCETEGTHLLNIGNDVDLESEEFLDFMILHCDRSVCYTGEHRTTALSSCQGGTVSLTRFPYGVTTQFIDCPWSVKFICFGIPFTKKIDASTTASPEPKFIIENSIIHPPISSEEEDSSTESSKCTNSGFWGKYCQFDAACLRVEPDSRVKCIPGDLDVTESQCLQHAGCCWDSTRHKDSIHCYKRQPYTTCDGISDVPVDCEVPSLNQAECDSNGCCWNESTTSCFSPQEYTPQMHGRRQEACDIAVENRTVCGYDGIRRTECKSTCYNGHCCCYDRRNKDSIPCFLPLMV